MRDADRRGSRTEQRVVPLIAVPIFAVACALPVFDQRQGPDSVLGIHALLMCRDLIVLFLLGGWANFVFLAGLIMLARGRESTAAVLGVAAFLGGLSYPVVRVFASAVWALPRPGPGYYFWLASFATLALGGLIAALRHTAPPTKGAAVQLPDEALEPLTPRRLESLPAAMHIARPPQVTGGE